MNFYLTGLPAFALAIGFIIIGAAPVWLAAQLTAAKHASMARAVASLFLGVAGCVISASFFPLWSPLLVPLSYLLSFKWTLGTSFFGAILLGVLAVLGYVALIYFLVPHVAPVSQAVSL